VSISIDNYTPYLMIDRFPLFSRGVDTYRFEYGVFLLNKNIEFVRLSFSLERVSLIVFIS
jgi:hypothetical protein